MKGRVKVAILIAVILVVIASIIYNIKINKAIKVVTQEIKIKDLPEELDGFTILQLTDLHSMEFGENQKDLIDLVNSLQYDMISINGDMQNSEEGNYLPFIELLEGIENKDEVYYTPGNHGPYKYEGETVFMSFLQGNNNKIFNYASNKKVLTDFGEIINEMDVKYLDKAYEIKRGDESLWISELIYKKDFDKITGYKSDDNDIKIAITHYPMDDIIYESDYGERLGRYDLVLAGHYHGGQWRIPLFGAFLVPDIISNGWFPSQDSVSGLKEYRDFKQYVSKGLGGGGPIKPLRFRVFNEPEIDLIILRKE